MPAPPPAPPAAAGGARTSGKGTPEVKYSTARSGLLKAARIARTTCTSTKKGCSGGNSMTLAPRWSSQNSTGKTGRATEMVKKRGQHCRCTDSREAEFTSHADMLTQAGAEKEHAPSTLLGSCF
eukprot:1136228-Pelagomonas_calceolata.AAC.6